MWSNVKHSDDYRAAQRAVTEAVRRAEAMIDAMMDAASDTRSREAISAGIEWYTENHGEPRFRIDCYRCGRAVVDLPLVYPSARGLWTWMPPAYYVARFNHDESHRRCDGCGAEFPVVELD